jgi:hypothetical protein
MDTLTQLYPKLFPPHDHNPLYLLARRVNRDCASHTKNQQERLKQVNGAFLKAFADVTKLKASEADEQWAGFSRQLSDSERTEIENGGSRSGHLMGEEFLKLYPMADRD